MSFTTNKSDIAEGRDQLSLDYADDKYLSIIGQNLGVHQHLFHYGDDTWRAIIKTLALDYKQVLTKFNDLLEILFGPKITETGSLAQSVIVGDTSFFMNDVTRFPQVGTLTFDKGLATEETLTYRFINRSTNEVVLDTMFAFPHVASVSDAHEFVVNISDSSPTLICSRTDFFPTSDYPYPVLIGRGLPGEAVYSVINNNATTSSLTLDSVPSDLHHCPLARDVVNELALKYFPSSTSLFLEDSTQFSPQIGTSGLVKLFPTVPFTVSATGTLSSFLITVDPATFTANTLQGYEVIFDGNITSLLFGYRQRVLSNTASSITFPDNFVELGVFPHLGDTFSINPIVTFTSNNTADNTLNLHKGIPAELGLYIAAGSKVELLCGKTQICFAPIIFQGAGWDIIQSTPKLVEILIPPEIRDINDLRSASYLHDDTVALPLSSTVFVSSNIGETQLSVSSNVAFPDSGVIVIDDGGANQERLSYGKLISYLVSNAPLGSNTLVLEDSSSLPNTGTILVNNNGFSEESFSYTNNDEETGTLTLSTNTTFLHRVGETVSHTRLLSLQSELQYAHVAPATTVKYYSPLYVTTDLPIGDPNQVFDTYTGPYLYDFLERAPTVSVALTFSSTIVPGPTLLSMSQVNGNSTIEVVNAVAMLAGLTTPFNVSLGRETLSVNKVSLRSRVGTTVSSASIVGDRLLSVVSLNLGSLVGSGFPEGRGYRIVIDEDGPNQEVAYVVSIESSPDKFGLEQPLSKIHNIGEKVSLMSDVLTIIDTPTRFSHTGLLASNIRSTALAGPEAYLNKPFYNASKTRTVRPRVERFALNSVSGLDIDGGTVLFNYGNGLLPASNNLAVTATAGATSITLVSASSFPSVYPYEITIDSGTRKSETLLVTNKVGNVLTLGGGTYGVKFTHQAGAYVYFIPGDFEQIDYFDVDSNELCFNPSIMLKYSHYPSETVIDSSVYSDPRDDGYDFPFRVPVDIAARLEYLLDLIRAAGIRVEIISKR